MIVVNWSTSQSQMQMKFKRISVERSKYLSICEILNHNIHSFNFKINHTDNVAINVHKKNVTICQH